MRTIAGQINGFDFQSISQGVSDPTLGADVRAIFKRDWQSQIVTAAKLIGPPTVDASNLRGNEHLGAAFGAVASLPDLAIDLPLPPGALLGFAFSIDAVVKRVVVMWDVLTGQNSRLNTNGAPDSGGPIELQTITIATSGDTWMTTIKGLFHTPAGLPNAPFTITQSEFLFAVGTAIPASFALSYLSPPARVQVDTSSLELAITAIEVFGGVALIGLAGVFGVPISALGASTINTLVTSKLHPITLQFQTIDVVANSIPQRTRLPGTIDNLWLHFDTVSFPQGTIATLVNEALMSSMPGTAIVLSGRLGPTRAQREGFVMVTGPEILRLPPRVSGHPVPSPAIIRGTYTALVNDEVVNPSFTWSVTDPHGHPLAQATLSSTTGPSVTVTFSTSGVTPSTPLLAVIRVSMHDDLNLKDAQGQTPATDVGVTIEAPAPVPVPRPPRPPRPLRPEPPEPM